MTAKAKASCSEPALNCPHCPRLADFRAINASKFPDYFNAPVPAFGSMGARLLIVGLAPGLHGANRTGRPFTGDFAGDLLFATLKKLGCARGTYDRRSDDGLKLNSVCIANAVRCVPPENKPLPVEIRTCRPFLSAHIAAMPKLKVVLTLGKIAHDSVCDVLAIRKATHPFKHGASYVVGDLTLIASYHCSRYNTNTGVLTESMFHEVVGQAAEAAGLLTNK